MINRDKLRPHVEAAEKGSPESAAVVAEVLRPLATDSVDEIYEKLRIYIRLIFLASLKYEDSPDHKKIDYAIAQQVQSYLTTGRPRWKGIIIVGYRESAKTTRVKFGQSYMSMYLSDIIDYTNVVSEDGSSADQFNMDMFNTFAFSKLTRYFPNIISDDTKAKKKESQTMSKFTTATGVTFAASGSRKSKRGNVKVDIGADGEIETKRPKEVVFDDIENETTVKSVPVTQHIGSVMSATIDGMDQVAGFWILLGNYLSLRGNVARMLKKYENDPQVLTIMIPILDGAGNVTWPGKYVRTDAEEREAAEKGIVRRSVESIQRDSDNFETEYLNNPKRNKVYFDDNAVVGIDEDRLIGEYRRTEAGLLILEEPELNAVYVMAADAAKGNGGGDQSSFTVYETTGLRYKEVANFKSNKIKPEDFAKVVANNATKYNHALVIPENNYPGNELIAFLLPIYNNIYNIVKGIDKATNKEIREYGVNTNLKTKPEMFLHYKKLLLDRLVDIRSRALYDQVLEYPSDDVHIVKQKDGSGGHFDLLMSAVIALYKAAIISVVGKAEDVSDAAVARVVDSVFEDVPNHR